MLTFMIGLLIISFIGMLSMMYHFGDWGADGDGILIFLLIFVFFMMCMGYLSTQIYLGGHSDGYKQGQIDALSSSNIKYELKVQPDSSRVWVRKDAD